MVRLSASRVIVDLIESGLEAKEREKVAFFDLAERLAQASDRAERERLKAELARLTFGQP